MNSTVVSLKRKRVSADPLPAMIPANRCVEFHEVGIEHIFSTWALNAKVFWKGNIRQHGGTRYLRVILKDEEGTKMEAVAYDDKTMRFDGLLVQGQEYEFFGVGFLPTWIDDMSFMFHLHSDFYVYLSTHSTVNAQTSIFGFP
ncbi:uncharacterized protein LOC110430833 [Sorghum bicolor]|uniref:uncharacterized protein LOC110430833 n=1 Tax=Sorghum bicolor TaxID=4558 RepID=UPI000B4247A8|nr:uncharacterized protein LOC110430833 [Sorghum bicolor]|eukprot:XP_021304551.1 uncharacterized protein LOC110430833 [Sorghum bicolor]